MKKRNSKRESLSPPFFLPSNHPGGSATPIKKQKLTTIHPYSNASRRSLFFPSAKFLLPSMVLLVLNMVFLPTMPFAAQPRFRW